MQPVIPSESAHQQSPERRPQPDPALAPTRSHGASIGRPTNLRHATRTTRIILTAQNTTVRHLQPARTLIYTINHTLRAEKRYCKQNSSIDIVLYVLGSTERHQTIFMINASACRVLNTLGPNSLHLLRKK